MPDETYEELLKKALEKAKAKTTGERFEMPRAEVAAQGAQTIMRNFSQVAAALRRDEKHLLKYLAKEMAAPAHLEGGRAVFQGALQQRLLQQKLESYAKEYVLCRECGKPDTKLVKEGGITILKCEACGARAPAKRIKG